MAYVATTDVTAYGDFVSSDDDALIAILIARATSIIETETGRVFEAVASTKKFSSVENVDGRTLYLTPEEFVALASDGITNGDSDAGDITSSDYVLLPANTTPKFGIELLPSTNAFWSADTDGNHPEAISVHATWGYSTTPPADIQQATVRLTLWLYKQRSVDMDLERPLLTGDGVTVMPARLPNDVMSILSKYMDIGILG
jgi:hypothetical protein